MKTFHFLVIAALIALAAGCAKTKSAAEVLVPNDDPRAPGWHEMSMDVGGTQRWFRYLVPTNVPPRPPVVVLLHGGKMSMSRLFQGRSGATRAWIDVAEREGFILLTPNGTNPKTGDTRGDDQNWNDLRPAESGRHSKNDDVRFITGLLDWSVATLHADPRRAYITGASNGGMMTYRVLVEAPERFAAAAVFIATLPADRARVKQPARPVPLMICNGTADPIMKWRGGRIPAGGPDQSSTPDTLAWWIKANHAQAGDVKTEELPDVDPNDHCRISRTEYPAQPGGAPVLFYKIEGGGHSMPSRRHEFHEGPILQEALGIPRDVEGAEIAWDFMKQFAAPAPK